MNVRPSILCAIDYSDVSAGALRDAAAIAEHFVTRLIVLTVETPRSTAAVDVETGSDWSRATAEREIATFVAKVFADQAPARALCEYEVAMGRPAIEILRVARERSCDLIVMGALGVAGPHKWLVGSTTERVLRETRVPVLVTPRVDQDTGSIEDARRRIGCIIAPVDLSPAALHQTMVASGLAAALGLPLAGRPSPRVRSHQPPQSDGETEVSRGSSNR